MEEGEQRGGMIAICQGERSEVSSLRSVRAGEQTEE